MVCGSQKEKQRRNSVITDDQHRLRSERVGTALRDGPNTFEDVCSVRRDPFEERFVDKVDINNEPDVVQRRLKNLFAHK